MHIIIIALLTATFISLRSGYSTTTGCAVVLQNCAIVSESEIETNRILTEVLTVNFYILMEISNDVENLQETVLSLGLAFELVVTYNARVSFAYLLFKYFIGRIHVQQYVDMFRGLASIPVGPLNSPIHPGSESISLTHRVPQNRWFAVDEFFF